MTMWTISGLMVTAALLTQAVAAQDLPTPPVDARKAEAEIATAQAGARKARAEAQKAEQDLYGLIATAAGARGAAAVNAGAGAVEAAAVATQSLSAIATELRPQAMLAYDGTGPAAPDADLPAYCDVQKRDGKKALVIVTEDWEPDTGLVDAVDPTLTARAQAADDLKTRVDLLIPLLQRRVDTAAPAPVRRAGTRAGGFGLPVITAGVSAFTAAMKTDVDSYGVALAGGDAILLRAVAGNFKTASPATPVFVPGIDRPSRGPAKALLKRFAALDARLGALAGLQADLSAMTNKVNGLAAAAGEKAPLATTYGEIATDIALVRAPLDAFVAAQQAWLAGLTDVSKGRTIAQIAAEQAEIGCIQAEGGLLVRLKTDAFGGSIFTRKNLWTTFGGTPIFLSAGGVVTFSFSDLRTGDFINSGVASSMAEWQPIIRAGPRGSVSTVNFRPVRAAGASR